MTGNYANAGYDVAFMDESAENTELRVSDPSTKDHFVVELKRLQRGRYESVTAKYSAALKR